MSSLTIRTIYCCYFYNGRLRKRPSDLHIGVGGWHHSHYTKPGPNIGRRHLAAEGHNSPLHQEETQQIQCRYITSNIVDFNFPNILNSICFSKADLSSLIRLDVSGNSIENIDIIDRVPAPHLKELRIQNNRIIVVRPVRKCFWPHLQWLNLSICLQTVENNPLKDTAFLAELKCH